MWVDIKDYEGIYQINEQGEIRCLITGKGRGKPGSFLKPQRQTKGYLEVCLRKDGEGKRFRVHRLVAQHFIPNPNNLLQVNHKDRDKTNNSVDNLEWVDNQQNCEHAIAKTYFLKSPEGQVVEIFNMASWLRSHPEFSPRCIQNVIRGKRKTAYGWSLP